MRYFRILLAGAGVLISFFGFSQNKTTQSNQLWIQYYGQMRVSPHWIVGLDGGFRWRDSEPYQYIVRGALGYELNKHFRISAGLVSSGIYANSRLNRIEFRPYQELLYSNDKKLLIQQRLRVEERFFKLLATADTPASHDFNFRFRYQISFSIPVVSVSAAHPDRRISIGVSDEIFINAGNEIVYNTFDRNRFVVGPVFHFSKSLSIALSYMMQYTKANQPATYSRDNVLWMTARHTIKRKAK